MAYIIQIDLIDYIYKWLYMYKEHKILLVDDDEFSREFTAAEIELHTWYKVDTVSDWIDAIEKACSTRYSIILMDFNMPWIDWMETTRDIRHFLKDDTELKIFWLSWTNNVSDANEWIQSWMDEFIAKPMNPATFERLKKLLDSLPDNWNEK